MQPKPLEQNRLVLGRLGHTSFPDRHPASGRQHNIDQGNLADLIEHLARLIAQSGLPAELSQRLPLHISQKAHQNVRLYALALLVPNRPQLQIRFVNPERRLGLGQLDVGAP